MMSVSPDLAAEQEEEPYNLISLENTPNSDTGLKNSDDDVPYDLLDSEHLFNSAEQDRALSLHSYSQSLPNITSNSLHNYCSKPVNAAVDTSHNYSQPFTTGRVDSSHTYSQPWPQTNNPPELHDYCMSSEKQDEQTTQKTRIYQVKRQINEVEEPLCLKIQYSDTFTCHWSDCNSSFTNQRLLITHLNITHIDTQTPPFWYCYWKHCKRDRAPFHERCKFVQHMRIHTCEKPHKCMLCMAEFSSAEGLTRHQRTHTGEKPCVCTYPGCSKAFKNSADKHKHMKTHTDPYPYRCKHSGCDKKYTDPGSLRKHMRKSNHKRGPQLNAESTIKRKIESAVLLHNSGLETSLNVQKLNIVHINAESPMLSSTVTSYTSTVQDLPLDLTVQQDPNYYTSYDV